MLARDRPLLTTELHVWDNATFSAELLRFTHALGYDAFLVDETCGTRADCRNVIHVPRASATDARRQWLRAADGLVPVGACSIFSACNCSDFDHHQRRRRQEYRDVCGEPASEEREKTVHRS